MKTYNYLAKNNKGEISKGSLEAENNESAAEAIENQSLTPISIKAKEKTDVIAYINTIGSIPTSEKVMFAKQLATLISAGIPISQSMHILESQTQNDKLKKAVVEIAADIEGGLSLSSAMEKQKGVFNALYVSMIKAGEVGGILEQTLEKISEEIEKEHDLVVKIRGAMAYPAVIFVAMIGVVIYMVTSIIPQIGKIFGELGGKLPASTQFMMDLSEIIKNYGILIAIGIAFSIFGIRILLKRNDKFRYNFHKILNKLPLFGKLIVKVNVSRFSRTLGSLLSSGVTVLEAMKVAANTIQNEVFRKEIKEAAEKVKNGSSVADSLKNSKNFPMIVSQMIAVGEETGTMDKILDKLTEYYEKEISNAVGTLSSLIEPLMMIIAGIVVGFIVISVISPIYEMGNLF